VIRYKSRNRYGEKTKTRSTLRYGPVTDYVLPPVLTVCVCALARYDRYGCAAAVTVTGRPLHRSAGVATQRVCCVAMALRNNSTCSKAPRDLCGRCTTLHVWREETTIDAIFFMEHQSSWQLKTGFNPAQPLPAAASAPMPARGTEGRIVVAAGLKSRSKKWLPSLYIHVTAAPRHGTLLYYLKPLICIGTYVYTNANNQMQASDIHIYMYTYIY
jgi:hypothetical protein